MEIVTRANGGSVDITVVGTIKSISDGQSIKDSIKKVFENDNQAVVNLHIKDSFIITSSVIGFLIKLIKIDKRTLFVHVKSAELYSMLEDMSLLDSMNVKKG